MYSKSNMFSWRLELLKCRIWILIYKNHLFLKLLKHNEQWICSSRYTLLLNLFIEGGPEKMYAFATWPYDHFSKIQHPWFPGGQFIGVMRQGFWEVEGSNWSTLIITVLKKKYKFITFQKFERKLCVNKNSSVCVKIGQIRKLCFTAFISIQSN